MKQILKVSLTVSGALLTAFPAAKAQKKPNILFIMTDQQRWDALGYSGNKVIKTPNLDRLAASGAYFRQAVTQCAVSGPSRTAILTDRTIEKTKILTNDDTKSKKQICFFQSFDEILSTNGYHAEYHGKFHSPKEMLHIYKNPSVLGLKGPQVVLGDKEIYKDFLKQNNFTTRPLRDSEVYAANLFAGIPYTPNPIDKRYGESNDIGDKTDPHGCLDLPENLTFTAFTGQQAITALDRVASETPFTLTCSFVAPHPPVLPSEPYYSMYNAKDMPLPPSIDDDLKGPYKRYRKQQYSDKKTIGYFIADYYAMVTEVDAWVGKLLDKLDELELTENTVVVFTSDHGEMLGSHGMQNKFIFLEESVRVPLIIRYPKAIPAGLIIDNPVSLINIYPTLMDLAGISGTSSDGYSLMSLIKGETPKYDFAVSEWPSNKPNVPHVMIRTQKWKLCLSRTDNSGAADLMYDMKNDPYEFSNLLTDNSFKSKNKELITELQKKLVGYLNDIEHPYAADIEKRMIIR